MAAPHPIAPQRLKARPRSSSAAADLNRVAGAKKLGPFTIHGVLGSGGMGIVLDATSTRSGRRVALKLLRPASDEERGEMMLARFMREARLIQQLDHPGVVGFVDAGELEGMAYLALERIEGVTLASLRTSCKLDPTMLLSLAAQLASALEHLHACGVIHRDIKPTNVIVTHAGRAVLADFGVAWSPAMARITRVGEIVGTPGYMAPELVSGDDPSPLSDQYALGYLLFESAATRPRAAVQGALFAQFMEALEIDWSRFPGDAEWDGLRAILTRMLARDPNARFATTTELSRALSLARRANTSSPPLGHAALADEAPWLEVSPFEEEAPEPVTQPSAQHEYTQDLAALVDRFEHPAETVWTRRDAEVETETETGVFLPIHTVGPEVIGLEPSLPGPPSLEQAALAEQLSSTADLREDVSPEIEHLSQVHRLRQRGVHFGLIVIAVAAFVLLILSR